jgi:hypothetical protein
MWDIDCDLIMEHWLFGSIVFGGSGNYESLEIIRRRPVMFD